MKTNLEMVRIFKQLRGTVNTEITEYNSGRLFGLKVIYLKEQKGLFNFWIIVLQYFSVPIL